jgi:23S rRNA-/tRNA-specific pseudouridylate synthase
MTPAATAVLRESTASCACVESQADAATTATLPASEAPPVRALRGPTRVLSREEAAALPPAERWMRIAGPTQVLFSDEHIVVCSKESGLLSVPGIAVKDSLATRIAVQFDQDRIGELQCCVVLAAML